MPCVAGTIVEEYAYHLPKGTKILAVPKGTSVSAGSTTCRSMYAFKGGNLTVKRQLDDKPSGNICPPAKDFAELTRKVAKDLKAQVVYQ